MGEELISPCSTLELPSAQTATVGQSPAAVSGVRLRRVSTTALAAEAAEEEPRALITAAPRCWTVGMKDCSTHSGVTSALALLPCTSACERSGYCVAE